MASQHKIEFEGKDIAEAISKACKTFKVSQENLDIEVLTTGTSGIFGLCRQKARLRVSVKKEYRETPPEKPAPKPARPAKSQKQPPPKQEIPARKKAKATPPPPKPEEVVQTDKPGSKEKSVVSPDLLGEVKADLARILDLMQYPSEVAVTSENENVTVRIKGNHVDEIIEQNGKLLDNLQYLTRKIIGKKYNEKAIISLDAGDFRASRNEELKQLGLELAAEVKKSGKTRAIPSLNPSERRVVHVALQDDKSVRSRSVGEGLFKKVLIYSPGSKGKKGQARKKRGGRNKKADQQK